MQPIRSEKSESPDEITVRPEYLLSNYKNPFEFISRGEAYKSSWLVRFNGYREWEYARQNGYCIVTFDSDYYDLSIVKGSR